MTRRSIAPPDEMRRASRFRACCRVDVCQRHGVWTAITEELSARGCRLLTRELPRLGATLEMTLSTDLFGDDLETAGQVVWIDAGRIGVRFRDGARRSRTPSRSAAEWVERVLATGGMPGAAAHVVPAIVDGGRLRDSNVVALDEVRAQALSRSGATRAGE